MGELNTVAVRAGQRKDYFQLRATNLNFDGTSGREAGSVRKARYPTPAGEVEHVS